MCYDVEAGIERSSVMWLEPVVASPALRAVFQAAAEAASATIHPLNVLILGEAGVGKRTLAHWLHHRSSRAAGPLAWVRCDGPVDPLAKTIFGWDEPGLPENAKDGTVVLEHVDARPRRYRRC